jgi:glycosyltransferase involved in cell wall biosynthesis
MRNTTFTTLNLPLVSVIIPAYNAERFIKKTLNSVFAQTYSNLEIIVVDDGSCDRTARIVEQFSKSCARVSLLQQQQSGVAVARNAGILKAKGEFIAPLDADDIWHPRNIEIQVQNLLKEGPGVGLTYAWSAVIDEDGRITDEYRVSKIEGNVYATLLTHNFLGNASASVIRRACFDKIGLYDAKFAERNAQCCEDWDVYLRIARFFRFKVVPEFMIGYRRVEKSMSRDYKTMAVSHQMLLEKISEANDGISDVLCRISTVNLYLYIAHQNLIFDDCRGIVFWLRKAFQIDMVTTIISFRFYSLFIKSYFRVIYKIIACCNFSKIRDYVKEHDEFGRCDNKIRMSLILRKRIDLFFFLFIEKVYHWFIRKI